MKRQHQLLSMAAITIAAAFPTASHALEPIGDKAPIVALDENFNEPGSPPGWTLENSSAPPGQGWSRGNPGIFPAPSGPASSYIAANYLSAQNGTGSIDNWLITPVLTLIGPSELSFFTRSAGTEGFGDMLEVRFSYGSGSDTSGFDTLLRVVGGASDYPTSWQQFMTSLDYEGEGRFAFRYLGDAAAANYIGIDAVQVTTVPEPGAYLMLLAGLGALAVLRRRQAT